MVLYKMGEETAFEILFERHAGRVHQFLLNKLVNRELAQDVSQQAFLKLHRSREKYNPEYPFLPWLFTIVKTSMMDAMRERVAKKRIHDSHEIEEAVYPVLEEQTALAVHLEALPAMQKDAVSLRFIGDYSFEEIAERLGTSDSNARQLVSRGIRKLKSILSGKGES